MAAGRQGRAAVTARSGLVAVQTPVESGKCGRVPIYVDGLRILIARPDRITRWAAHRLVGHADGAGRERAVVGRRSERDRTPARVGDARQCVGGPDLRRCREIPVVCLKRHGRFRRRPEEGERIAHAPGRCRRNKRARSDYLECLGSTDVSPGLCCTGCTPQRRRQERHMPRRQ